MSAGEHDHPAVQQGIDFLLDRQTPDGTWEEEEWTGTGFPKVFYLRYHFYRHYFPLAALGKFYRESVA
jgi:squalene-hopene/tetraprenyl-beta-curcumene cyclase